MLDDVQTHSNHEYLQQTADFDASFKLTTKFVNYVMTSISWYFNSKMLVNKTSVSTLHELNISWRENLRSLKPATMKLSQTRNI